MSIDSEIMGDFKAALLGIRPDKTNWHVTSYDDESDFKALWELQGNGDADLDLVIIWDGMPEDKSGGINILDHLTPYDWALSFSYQQLRKKQRDNKVKLPDLRILIVDLFSHHQPNALAVKMLPAFCHAMPWMQVFRPLPLDDKYTLTLCELVDWAKNPDNKPLLSSYQPRNALNQLEPVVDAWVGNVSRGSDHHAIANLIAPRLLLEPSDLSEEQDPAKEALSRLVDKLGLLPHQDKAGGKDSALLSADNHWIDWEDGEWKQKLARLGDGKKLKLLILDDQWKDGWGEVICKAVGAAFDPPKKEEQEKEGFISIGVGGPDNGIEVKASGFTEWLVGDGKLISNASDERFKLRLDQNGEDCQEILFLDLRLFSKGTVDEEATFIEQLLQIAEKSPSSDFPKKLPWPGFDADDLNEIREWLKPENRGREKSGYHKALTLLPRIISLIDLSYPIILFSSTGQRHIVEQFKEYGNIITNFEKPRLTGALAKDLANQSRGHFIGAFDQAMEYLTARYFCALLPESMKSSSSKSQNGTWTIELYVDETGSESNRSGLRVEGILAIFPPDIIADDFNKKIIDKFKDEKLLDADGKSRMRAMSGRLTGWVQEEAKKDDVHLAIVSLAGQIEDAVFDDSGEYGVLDDERVGDNLWRELVSCLTEIAVYGYAKKYCPIKGDIVFHAYYPTRHIPLRHDQEKHRWFNKWGIPTEYVGINAPLWRATGELYNCEPNNVNIDQARTSLDKAKKGKDEPDQYVRTFSFDSARPLVQRLAQLYRWANFRPRADHARAYPLNSFYGRKAINKMRALHLLSDAIIGATGREVNNLRNQGFQGKYGANLQIIMHAYRAIANGFVGEGLAIASDIGMDWHRCEEKTDVVRLLAEDIYQAAQDIIGRDFVELVAHRKRHARSADKSAGTSSKEIIKGVVSGENKEFYSVKCNNKDYRAYKVHHNKIVGRGDSVEFTLGHGSIPGEWVIQEFVDVSPHPAWARLKEKDEVTGTVKFVLEHIVFFNVDGIDGCLRRSNPKIRYYNHAKVKLNVSKVDVNQRKLILTSDKEINIDDLRSSMLNQTFAGFVTRVNEYKIFVKLTNGQTGVIWSKDFKPGTKSYANSGVKIGDKFEVIVFSVTENGNIKLRFINNITGTS